ncbi:MAG: peptidase M23, partial [Bacteroidetes bacterium CG_4_9_14_3_um_filter_41_19]
MGKNKKVTNKWFRNLRAKYRFVILNDSTFEERFTFKLNRLNVMISLFSLGIIFITLTFFLIANTPIKQLIPGYPDVDQKKELYRLNVMADSLLSEIEIRNKYFESFKAILNNKVI